MFIYLKLLTLLLSSKYTLSDYHEYNYLNRSDDIDVSTGFDNRILSIKVTKSKRRGAKVYIFRTKNY
jgi:hypothetical protein